MRLAYIFAVAAWSFGEPLVAQTAQEPPKVPGYRIESTPLPAPEGQGIIHLPLEVDIERAEQFIKLGFAPNILGQRGFYSTQFLTPRLNTKQAAQLVRLVPEYGKFKGAAVGEAITSLAGRVSGVEFGREGSPVLYFHLPYWTNQREGPVGNKPGARISDAEHSQLVSELRRIFVDQLGAQEFGPDRPGSRSIRVWWHHS